MEYNFFQKNSLLKSLLQCRTEEVSEVTEDVVVTKVIAEEMAIAVETVIVVGTEEVTDTIQATETTISPEIEEIRVIFTLKI